MTLGRHLLVVSLGGLCVGLTVSCDEARPDRETRDASAPDAAAPADDGGVPDGSVGDADVVAEPVQHAPGYRSGSRLKAQALAGDGTARQFQSWFDTKLEQDCEFHALEPNGTPYCLPSGQAFAAYGDASCQDEVWVAYTTEAGPYLSGHDAIFRVDTTLTEPVFTTFSGSCERDDSLRRVARVDDWSKLFVRGRYEVRQAAQRLTTWEVFSDDGAWQVRTLYDQEQERRCNRRPLNTRSEPASFCVPTTVAFEIGFGDDTCKTPLAYVNTGYGFDVPLIALSAGRVGEAHCAFAAYAIEGPYEGDSYWTDYGTGTCDRRSRAEPWLQSLWLRSAEPYDTGKLAELAFFREGEGRLQRYFEGPRGGRPLVARSGDKTFFDTELGLDCDAQPTADGKVRCIPRTASLDQYAFADPSCMQALVRVSKNVDARLYDDCAPQKVAYVDENLPTVSRVYALGPAHEGPLYGYLYDEDGAAECGIIEDDDLFEEHQLGEEVPLGTFAELRRVVEP